MENYFDTLSQALDAAKLNAEACRAEIAGADWETLMLTFGPVSYGQTVTRLYSLAFLKGKSTRKGLNITIYRMESGRYELTTYIA